MKLLQLIVLSTLISCNSNTSNEYILKEEFNENTLGYYSSNGPRDNSFMWSLPENWQFSTSIEIIDGGSEAGYGFILYSASLNYEFILNRKGNVNISEYDYNKETGRVIVDEIFEDLSIEYNTPTTLELRVEDTSFEFYVNDLKVGQGSFAAKSWANLRLFATAGGTGIKADYFRIKSL
ncbi:hypothetical protein [Marivirga sp.]|uniref:hypothetical protein n=1 Tax=Marivirga sp. TaxID=2018662 RepID=UPI0025F651BE|nr:hypothetical protein [Marivirga sp.]